MAAGHAFYLDNPPSNDVAGLATSCAAMADNDHFRVQLHMQRRTYIAGGVNKDSLGLQS
jgi:hypothetical protein